MSGQNVLLMMVFVHMQEINGWVLVFLSYETLLGSYGYPSAPRANPKYSNAWHMSDTKSLDLNPFSAFLPLLHCDPVPQNQNQSVDIYTNMIQT